MRSATMLTPRLSSQPTCLAAERAFARGKALVRARLTARLREEARDVARCEVYAPRRQGPAYRWSSRASRRAVAPLRDGVRPDAVSRGVRAAELHAVGPSCVFTILNSTRRFFSQAGLVVVRVLRAVLAVPLAPELVPRHAALHERRHDRVHAVLRERAGCTGRSTARRRARRSPFSTNSGWWVIVVATASRILFDSGRISAEFVGT